MQFIVKSVPHVSYSSYEFTVDMEKKESIIAVNYDDPPPALQLLALNICTAPNQNKENEVNTPFSGYILVFYC